jgi:hypothetical protein
MNRHQNFLVGNTKHIRMKYYVEGQFRKGTVHLEKKMNVRLNNPNLRYSLCDPISAAFRYLNLFLYLQDSLGKFQYSYLVVDIDGYPPRRIEIDAKRLD